MSFQNLTGVRIYLSPLLVDGLFLTFPFCSSSLLEPISTTYDLFRIQSFHLSTYFPHSFLSSVRLPPPNNVRSRYQHSTHPQHPISVRLRRNLVLRHSIPLLLLLPERPQCTPSERRLPRNRKCGAAKGATREGGNDSSYVSTTE